jgi:hypothetical protein
VSVGVRRYTPADQAAWDELVRHSRSEHFFFERGYMDYHADRFEDHSLLVLQDGKLVAALPAHLDGTGLASHNGLTFGGLLSGAGVGARRTLEIMAAVRVYMREHGLASLLYKAVPHIYHRVPAEEDLYALHRAGAELVRREVSSAIRLDARLPYSKGRRSDLKVAQRAGVEVGTSREFGPFMEFQRQVLKDRYDAEPVHSPDEMELLASRFPEAITLHTGTIGGRLVAGVVVYQTALVARAQYVAVDAEGRQAHALDKVVDSLLASYEGRKRWWDFGASTREAGRVLNEELIRNKESYGARAVVYDQYVVQSAAASCS